MKTLVAVLTVAGLLSAAGVKLGKPLALKEPVPLAALMAHPAWYIGHTVQVKGKISAVCQMMGCWMDLTDGGQKIRIKVNDGEIVFPKDSSGKTAIAEGQFKKIVLSREQAVAQAREEAKETGKEFNPASINHGVTYYQIQGSGAVILSE